MSARHVLERPAVWLSVVQQRALDPGTRETVAPHRPASCDSHSVRFVVGLVAVAGSALVASAACTRTSPAHDASPSGQVPAAASNVERRDYVGPERCGECHADQYTAWRQSLHRVMNARAEDPGAVIGDFDGASIAYAEGTVTFARDGTAYVMMLARGAARVRYRVTRTIGRRGLQEYTGVEDGHTEEVRLPFGWWPRAGGWVPQPAFDPWLDQRTFDPYVPVREPWAERCPWCHSTYPFAQRIARADALGVGHGLEQQLARSAVPPVDSVRAIAARLVVGEQVTTGISCESCHLGGRAHADGAPIHFTPTGAPQRPFAVERRDPAIIDAVCAQCHSGPSPRLADGTALRNSSEAIDLAASTCRGVACTDCHDPHRADARADEARAVAACTHCHDALADAANARMHAGDGHAGASCLDCHMPRVVMGIDRFVRTHRIAVPADPRLLADAAPNACNACHLDRSLAWTAQALHDGWDTNLPSAALSDEAAGEVWLASPRPAFRVFAAHAYARSPLGAAMRTAIARGLDDPAAYVRAWTRFAVEEIDRAAKRP
jgi:hypothetical protein